MQDNRMFKRPLAAAQNEYAASIARRFDGRRAGIYSVGKPLGQSRSHYFKLQSRNRYVVFCVLRRGYEKPNITNLIDNPLLFS